MTDTSTTNTRHDKTNTDTKKTIRLVPIPVENQNKDTLYKMKLNFALDIGIRSLDRVLRECGFSERPTLKKCDKLHH